MLKFMLFFFILTFCSCSTASSRCFYFDSDHCHGNGKCTIGPECLEYDGVIMISDKTKCGKGWCE